MTPGAETRDLYAVVLNWKKADATVRSVRSLLAAGLAESRMVLVDNDSQDGSFERFRREFPRSCLIQNEGNLGFSRGVNRGIKIALELGASHVALVNNDLVVGGTGFDHAMKECENDPSVGAVTGKILYERERETIWQAGGHISPWRVGGVARGLREKDRGQYERREETGWASGAFSVFPRRTFEELGLLPEEYFFGQEEWDYSTRLLTAKRKIIYLPELVGWHDAGHSYRAGHPVLITYNSYRNKLIYSEKYFSAPMAALWKLIFGFYACAVWPLRASLKADSASEWRVQVRAALFAFRDHRRRGRVELADLVNVSRELGQEPSWERT